MDEAAHVPQLQDDSPAGIMDGLRHGLPSLDLFVRPDARSRRPAQAFLRNAGGFGDNQPGACTLAVIFCFQLGDRYMLVNAATPCEG